MMLQVIVVRLGERLNLSGPVDAGSIYLVRWLCEMYVELNESCPPHIHHGMCAPTHVYTQIDKSIFKYTVPLVAHTE